MTLFDKALAAMGDSATLQPRPFISYAREAGFPNVKTAGAISVQSFRALSPELKNAGVMVFRFGSTTGSKGTSFALARHFGSWNDYFLQDTTVFNGCQQPIHVTGNQEGLRIFDILPKSTETSLVNLSIASGVLATALQLDSTSNPIINATAQGTYTFAVRPHQELNDCWHHIAGQVEIDGAFVAHRSGVETVFVVEAKVSTDFDSLAKHKLAYPMLAIKASISEDVPIVGIYLRVLRKPTGFVFCVAECVFSGTGQEVSSLNPVRAGAYWFDHGA